MPCHKTSVFRSLLSGFATISGHLHSCKSFVMKHLIFSPDGDFCCNLFILFKLRREFVKLGGGRGYPILVHDQAPQGWELGVPSTFTIVLRQTVIFCNSAAMAPTLHRIESFRSPSIPLPFCSLRRRLARACA